jgi:hypothetical protein
MLDVISNLFSDIGGLLADGRAREHDRTMQELTPTHKHLGRLHD